MPTDRKPGCLNDVENSDLSHWISSVEKLKFSRTGYGIKTMSMAVPISLKTINDPISFYNAHNPKNKILVLFESDEVDIPGLPKAIKLTSEQANPWSLRIKISFKQSRSDVYHWYWYLDHDKTSTRHKLPPLHTTKRIVANFCFETYFNSVRKYNKIDQFIFMQRKET
ncbi:hypothetical protein K501DRAFT_277147 [Backusella circina FSU 941]|nr:hypothetical protein K501DRAFT_277147 [Backusella circina FSU 941]